MQIFLTGGTGFIGQALVRTMRQRDWQIHTLVRDPETVSARWLAEQGCELVIGDITEPKGLSHSMGAKDVLIHNAGVYELGVNDHSVFGYFLRLYLLYGMPPIAWGGDAVYSLVEVKALAEGVCLAVEKAPIGEDFLFCGEPITFGNLLELWGRYPGGMKSRLWMPRWFMRPQMAILEPLQRWLGLPAFLSRDTIDVTKVHLNYSAEKAKRELGWRHPDIESIWAEIIPAEKTLMANRSGWLNKLRHQAVADIDTSKTT